MHPPSKKGGAGGRGTPNLATVITSFFCLTYFTFIQLVSRLVSQSCSRWCSGCCPGCCPGLTSCWCPGWCPGRGPAHVPAAVPAGVPLNAGELQPSDVVSSDPKFLLPRDGAVLDICVIQARIAGGLAVIPPDTVRPVHGCGEVSSHHSSKRGLGGGCHHPAPTTHHRPAPTTHQAPGGCGWCAAFIYTFPSGHGVELSH